MNFTISYLKSNFLLIFISLTWLSLLFSINTHPTDINKILNDPISFINASRFIFASLMSFLSIFLLIYFLLTKEIKKFSNLAILLILYFLFQIIGLINNDIREFNFDNTYLILFSYGALSILIILFNKQNNFTINFIFFISFVILSIAFFIVSFTLFDHFKSAIHQGNLYYYYHPDLTFLDQSIPRVTGATRAFALTSLALLSLLLIPNKKKISNITIFIFVLIYSMLVWAGQSRGSMICYYLTSFILIFFLNDFNITKKILIFLSITILSIFLSDSFIKIYNTIQNQKNIILLDDKKNIILLDDKKNNKIAEDYENLKNKKSTYKFSDSRVIQYYSGTSGRTDLWKKSYEFYDKRIIFGYGPQADRFLLNDYKNIYSNNSSNLIVYGFLSGGYFSFLSILILYMYIFYLLLKFILKNKILQKKYLLNKKNLTYTLSFLLVIFFSIRSIFENSFGLFSIDFLFMLLAAFTLEGYNKKFKF